MKTKITTSKKLKVFNFIQLIIHGTATLVITILTALLVINFIDRPIHYSSSASNLILLSLLIVIEYDLVKALWLRVINNENERLALLEYFIYSNRASKTLILLIAIDTINQEMPELLILALIFGYFNHKLLRLNLDNKVGVQQNG